MSFSLSPLLLVEEDVPARARAELLAATTAPVTERRSHLEAARALFDEAKLECADARAGKTRRMGRTSAPAARCQRMLLLPIVFGLVAPAAFAETVEKRSRPSTCTRRVVGRRSRRRSRNRVDRTRVQCRFRMYVVQHGAQLIPTP
jgi:hypothetical protein